MTFDTLFSTVAAMKHSTKTGANKLGGISIRVTYKN